MTDIRLSTPVIPDALPFSISLKDRIMVLGSCYADAIAGKLKAAGFDVMVNPLGTLYNPASVRSTILRLSRDGLFTAEDCVEMGAGAGKICSYEHHTSFARTTEDEFLSNANARLTEAREFWRQCTRVIITYGNSHIWEPVSPERRSRLLTGAVSNCLKRPAADFTRRMLPVAETASLTSASILENPDKKFIFAVSPIRHLSDGAHTNSLSKASLLLGVNAAISGCDNACYFPAFEIIMDELRDYRFYAEDMIHPSETAVEIIWYRFREAATPQSEQLLIDAAERESRRNAHIEKDSARD